MEETTTSIESQFIDVTRQALGAAFGPDRARKLVISYAPEKDLLVLRPAGTTRAEVIALADVYRYAVRCRVGRALLEKARERKAKRAERLARQRQERAEKRLFERR